MTNQPDDLKKRLQAHFAARSKEHPTILTELHARQAQRSIQLTVEHFALVCRLKMLWGWHIEIAPRKPYSLPLGVDAYYHLYTGGKRVVNHHGYPLIFGSLLEALTYDPVWATVGEALALVPEGCEWTLGLDTFQPIDNQVICEFLSPGQIAKASAATPAMALLAARLDWEERKEKTR